AIPLSDGGGLEGPPKNVRSHGWRSPSVTWTCRRSVFWEAPPTCLPTPSPEQMEQAIGQAAKSEQLRVNRNATQRVSVGLDDSDIDKVANHLGIVVAEIHNAVVLGAACVLAGVLLGQARHQDPLGAADHLPADIHHVLIQPILKNAQALLLHLHRRVVRQICRRGAGAGTVDKTE